jgi:3-dehydrosphinganine reductase
MPKKMKMPYFSGKKVVITGGSSGIGLAVAGILAQSGADIWLIARDQKKLEKAKADLDLLKISSAQKIGFSQADVSIEKSAIQAYNSAKSALGLPDIIINSAGISHPGYFQELTTDLFRSQMEINFFGTLNIIRAAINDFIARGSGHIVNISSMAGVIGVFGYTAYGASKYAIRGLTDTLRAEMKPLGIKFSIVFPPDTDTPQLAYETQFKPFETKIISGTAGLTSPDKVAADILHGIIKNRYQIFTGFDNKFLFWLMGKLGKLQYPMMDMMVNDAIKKKAKAGAKKAGS